MYIYMGKTAIIWHSQTGPFPLIYWLWFNWSISIQFTLFIYLMHYCLKISLSPILCTVCKIVLNYKTLWPIFIEMCHLQLILKHLYTVQSPTALDQPCWSLLVCFLAPLRFCMLQSFVINTIFQQTLFLIIKLNVGAKKTNKKISFEN